MRRRVNGLSVVVCGLAVAAVGGWGEDELVRAR